VSRPRIIRVVVADNHEMVRLSLAILFEAYDDIEIVGEAINGDDALRLCDEVQPDVLLLDLKLPVIDGLTVVRRVKQLYSAIKVIVLTYSSVPEDVTAAAEAGVSRYLLKDALSEEIVGAIRLAMQPPHVSTS
jgi:NarL family two-component system response regulator LiaR